MSVSSEVVGLEVLDCEIKRAGGAAVEPQLAPPCGRTGEASGEGARGEENPECFGLRSRVQVTGFGHWKKHFLQALFQLVLEIEGIQTCVEIA